ncbi:unnamed protein product [Ambrosiozyma monospora]|uniref:Unnamed protein product n=1 Tax=Ambrosiozyma monospora TaxID=43982 RepID=A0A9W6YWT0_AMBMO|nr:unnamed protein product [Ambrosiozyma monospora]
MEIASGAAVALLDTGTTLTYIPSNLLSIIVDALQLSVNSQTGYYTMACDKGDDYFLTFNFQGFEIEVPISSFLLDLTTTSGRTSSTCQLGLMSSGDETLILGDSFLRNVYLVVDLEDNVVAMAPANLDSNEEDIEAVDDSIPSAVSAASYATTWGDQATALSVLSDPSTQSLSSYAVAATYGADVDHSGNGTVSSGSGGSGSSGSGSSSSDGSKATGTSGGSEKSSGASKLGFGFGLGLVGDGWLCGAVLGFVVLNAVL